MEAAWMYVGGLECCRLKQSLESWGIIWSTICIDVSETCDVVFGRAAFGLLSAQRNAAAPIL